MAYLISCSHCECPVRSTESACPHCGETLRTAPGIPQPLTRAAIVLGLSAAVAATACESAAEYGVAGGADVGGSGPVAGAADGGSNQGGEAVGGAGGESVGGAGGEAVGGAGGDPAGGAGGQGGGAAPLYGIAGTGGAGGGKL
ncbi:MAG: hypothetical protein JNK04_06835 [Myxococcales bacterium]|nr:hypothetical protein [Myxococcales bacterium]